MDILKLISALLWGIACTAIFAYVVGKTLANMKRTGPVPIWFQIVVWIVCVFLILSQWGPFTESLTG